MSNSKSDQAPAPLGPGFASDALRLSVAIVEQLDAAERIHDGGPSTEGCYICLNLLREIQPLMGVLAPVLGRVISALELCLLSQEHFSDCGGEVERGHTPAERPRAGGSGGEPPAREPPRYQRVPFYVLVKKLQDTAASLREERDSALHRVSCNEADMLNIEEHLSVARGQLEQKTKTIDKLLRETELQKAELAAARERSGTEERRYEVLQAECAHVTRDFLRTVQRLEGEVDTLRHENEQLRSAALERRSTREALIGVASSQKQGAQEAR